MSAHREHYTRLTIDFPSIKHKQLKAVAALLGVPMKEFILSCVLEKLNNKAILKSIEDDVEAFDRGKKSIETEGFDTLDEVKRYLELE